MAHVLSNLSLNALLAVEVVARLGTLSRAADELGITPGAVSQKIIATEKRLGATLFDRSPTGLKPTQLGAAIAADLTRGFARIQLAVDRIDARAERQLIVSATPIFATRWLIWRLPHFAAKHPQIRVDLRAEPENRNPDLTDVDLCIRLGTGQWPDVSAEGLFPQRVFPVCNQEIAERLQRPSDLMSVPIIRDERTLFGWQVWLASEGLDAQDLPSGPSFSDAALCLDAAMTGAGVFLAWEALAKDPLANGRLVAPFAARRETGNSYWLVSGEDGIRSPVQRAFRTWLLEELGSEGLISPPRSGL